MAADDLEMQMGQDNIRHGIGQNIPISAPQPCVNVVILC